jgi:hypothetical protein
MVLDRRMTMRPSLFHLIGLFVAISLSICRANLGDTLDQSIARYGLSVNGESSKDVLLTNENMTTTGSPVSLIKCSQ